MNINDLENDEFVVECQLRGLRGTPKEQYDILKKTFNEEKEAPVLKPNKPHTLASKQPSREIIICSSKLKEFKAWVEENYTENDKELLSKMGSRIEHVLGRLKRISNSKKVQKDAKALIVVCSKIKSVVQQAIIGQKSLEDSKDVINELQLEEFNDLDDDSTEISSLPVETKLQTQVSNDILQTDLKTNNVANIPNESLFKIAQPGSSTDIKQPDFFVPQDQKNQISSAITELSEQNSELCNVLENIKQRIANNNYRSSENSTHSPSPRQIDDVISIKNANFFQPPPAYKQTSVPPTSDNFQNHYSFNNNRSFSRNYLPASKWNISFDGSRNGLSIDRFIYRVQHLAQANRISDNQLVNDLGFLLTGDALEWYWIFIERNNPVTWAKLHFEIKRRFQGNQCDDDIIQDIENKKQKWQSHPKENFLQFYSSILSLTLKLRQNYSDENLLRVLKRNMRPGLRLALVDQRIMTVDELARRCTALEDMWARTNFDPEANCQPKKSVNEMFYDCNSLNSYSQNNASAVSDEHDSICAYNAPKFQSQNYNSNFSKPHSQPYFQNVYKTPSPMLHCFNCHEFGHFMKNCTKPIPCAHCRNQFRTENYTSEQKPQGTPLLRHNNSVPTPALKNSSQVDAAVNTDQELSQRQS